MNLTRKSFLKTMILGCSTSSLLSFKNSFDDNLPIWKTQSLFNQIAESVIITSIELFKTQGELILVVNGDNGLKGIIQCNDRMQHLVSILKGLVIPHFIGKDVRNLTQLVDNAYRLNCNYKYAGMPLWNCIGSLEIACWDLLGKISQKPVYNLLGKQIRSKYKVYISDFNREGDPIKIANDLMEKLVATGAQGVKIKVGGRMTNSKENDTQTKKYIPTLRKILGENITIYADANGSYSAKNGIEVGKLLEDYGVEVFEEPCNFEDEEGMQKVNNALSKIKLAGGEQDSSLYRFKRFAQTAIYDILQPDLFYNGGILRTLQVSEIAKFYRKDVAPHTPKSDPLIAPFWQVAALIPNLYGLQECVYNANQPKTNWYSPEIKIINGEIVIPKTIGLGIEYDKTIFNNAEKIILN